jgi:kynurenine formamidase
MCSPAFVNEATKSKIAAYHAEFNKVSKSPFGADDQIGMLNLIDAASRKAIMSRIDPSRVFDLSVDYFVGMPGWIAGGDPTFQMWMTHTPRGTQIDNLPGVDEAQNQLVSYSGDAVSMYTHSGTHIDALNHFGYYGEIFNGFSAHDHLSSRNWDVAGADKHPPVIARGVLLDVPALLGIDELPASYGVGPEDLKGCLKRQGVELQLGDVILVRTGRMRAWPDQDAYIVDGPGITLEGARFLALSGASLLGTDTASFEQTPSNVPENWNVVHCYLLAEAGIPMLEIANLEELAAERVYEFAFVGACLRLRGATGAPIRPLAFPLQDR